MAATDMEEAAPPIEPAGIEPPNRAQMAPPPAITQARTRAVSGHRRWWIVGLAAALLVTAAGLGMLYVDDTNNQNAVRSLTTANESLTGRNQNLNDKLTSTQANLTATLGVLATTKAQLEHPVLTIWNVPQQLKGNMWYLAGGVPDTFTYHLQATSSGPMNISILTLEDWAKANQCVYNGVGPSDYCMHHSGAVMSWANVTTINYDFHLAEGCADYMVVFTAPHAVKVTPNVSVTYNPAPSPTGACT